MDKLVSIIVPVYNMEKLLPICLNSILNQVYKNIEIILVDDGSKDRSSKICDEYSSKDSRIKVFHQANMGIACAINKGLDNVKGDYILFVDSDDYISDQMVDRLLNVAEENDSDIVQCDYYAFQNEGGVGFIKNRGCEIIEFSTRNEILDDFFHHGYIMRNLSARIFKSCLFKNVRCEPGRQIIDAATLPKLLIQCNKYIYISEKHYYVYERPSSVSRRAYSLGQWEDCKYGDAFIEQFIKEKCPSFIDYVYYKYTYTTMKAYFGMFFSPSNAERENILNESLILFKKYYPLFKNSKYCNTISNKEAFTYMLFNLYPNGFCIYRNAMFKFKTLLKKLIQ